MREIHKGAEPRPLAQFRAAADLYDRNTYDNFPHKEAVRAQLAAEQRGLCAFCGGRIVNDPLRMKIAHWKPRLRKVIDPEGVETYPDLSHQLDYWNMLGACRGNEGFAPAEQHCDTHQGNERLSRNPANPHHHIEKIIAFLVDGSIASPEAQLNQELGRKRPDGGFERGVLNLNIPFLRNNRKGALDGLKQGLQKRGALSKARLEALLSKWRGDLPGELTPYAPVVAFWLRKRLAKGRVA